MRPAPRATRARRAEHEPFTAYRRARYAGSCKRLVKSGQARDTATGFGVIHDGIALGFRGARRLQW
jgi:hypothetical protein